MVFNFLQRPGSTSKLLVTIIAIIWGLSCVILLYTTMNNIHLRLPKVLQKFTEPFIFVGPATILLCWYLLFPTFRSLYLSFLDKRSEVFVGLENYIHIFTNKSMQVAFVNNISMAYFWYGTLCIIRTYCSNSKR